MKRVLEVCLIAFALACIMAAQDPAKPMRRPGISVKMPVASHAVEIPEADNLDAAVVSVKADGKIFLGLDPVDVTALRKLNAGEVYVKADARAPYQTVLTVLDALQGHPVALLTAPTTNAPKHTIMPPYGVKLTVGRR